MKRKGLLRFLALVMALALFPVPVSAKSSDEIREEITQLEQQAQEIQQLMAELEGKISDNFDQMEALVESKDAIDR